MRIVLCLAVIFFLAMACFQSCRKSSGDNSHNGTIVDCNAVLTKTFAAHINPIIQSFCNQPGCHDVASNNGPGPLTTYVQIFNARANIRVAVASGLMPQNAILTAAQKNSITCWIDSGAPNN